MTIDIIEKNLITDEFDTTWAIYIEIDNGIDSYLLPTTLNGAIAEGDLQTELEAKEAELFAAAEAKGISPDEIYTKLVTRRVLKAFALVVLDEINALRAVASLPARTTEQLRTALKIKLQSL